MALTLILIVTGAAGVWLTVARHSPPARSHAIALGASVVTLLLVLLAAVIRPEVDARWVPAIGLRWHFGVDGISIPLALLTAALTVAVVIHSRGREPRRDDPSLASTSTFYGCLMLVELGALATFFARDAVLFFVAFEIVLVPMWVIISRFGDEHRSEAVRADASGRFLLFTALGSTLMLVGILVLVTASGTSDLLVLAERRGAGLDSGTQLLVAILLVVGLGIKVPVWPLHTWLPPAHTVAPTAGSVLLAAVLLKMGTYGIVRLAIPTVPDGFATVAPFLAAAGAVGIIWGGLSCLVERDLKRLVAYSSVAHLGFVAIGLASGTQTGLQAALFANIAHGLVAALLFFVVGGLKERWGSADLAVARDALRDVSPRAGYALLVGFAAALGLPGLVGFWGEIMAVYAAWSPAPDRPLGLLRGCAVVAVIGLALAASYSLRVIRLVWAGHRDWAGPTRAETPEPGAASTGPLASGVVSRRTAVAPGDLRGAEWGVIATLVVAVIAGGVLPRPLLAVTAPEVAGLVSDVTPGIPADSAGPVGPPAGGSG